MKRYYSVFMVAVRSTIYKVTAGVLLMAVVEAGLFWLMLSEASKGTYYELELLVDDSKIMLACGAAFLIVINLLSSVGRGAGYTVGRLPVSSRTVGFLWTGWSVLCVLIFWALQLLVILALVHFYKGVTEPAYLNSQTAFLAFYRNGFLHSLLPLEDVVRWLRNGVFAVSLGLAAADGAMRQLQGKRAVKHNILALFTMLFFALPMGSMEMDVIAVICALVVGMVSFLGIWNRKTCSEEVS